MPLVTVATLLQLAAACPAQGVSDARLVATAKVESGFNSLAIHDNTTRRSYSPASVAEAIALTRSLLAQEHSLDAGVMQVNSKNWDWLRLNAETVFEPRLNICAGKAVLAEAYARERRVSCMYNSGKPDCRSSYPDKLEAAMNEPTQVAEAPVPLAVIAQPAAPPGRPPAWDVYAVAMSSRRIPAQSAPVQLTASRVP